MGLVDVLTDRALVLARDTFNDQAAVAELLDITHGNREALDHVIEVCLAQPVSLATRQRAIELLANALYGELSTGFGEAYRGSPVPVTRTDGAPAAGWAPRPRRCRPKARASTSRGAP